ncbi:ABC transporter ATP-binding protein [Thermotoga sp. 38H-to]|jgi:peptide/nickel transport system ATP-binding protein|uniref:ABC transporter ATP-binding protein n=1 Tax=Thermotoga sp. 38H-to TaxID=1755812 RepID=UPI0003FBB614|nr:ABC transporter ATP-binding protein [Thermotoga sp. 38H-to]KAF2959459.1 hypothetical protein AS158_07765 [Thermotoga sp. 38H-to]
MTSIQVRDLTAHYIVERYGEKKEIYALEKVSFSLNTNDFLAIVGESGCGKSTLAKVLYGEINNQLVILGGEVNYQFDDVVYTVNTSVNEVKKVWWEKLSYIPQASLSVLNPLRRIRDIFSDMLFSHGKVYEENSIVKHLDDLGLPSHILNMYPFELSGGMRQRVVIALATFMNPGVIIADEPTSALDVVTQNEILQLLKRIHRETDSTFIFITHDISLIPNLANKLMIMYGGTLVEIGETDTVFASPRHPYTKFLISSIPRIGDDTEKQSIPGYPPDLSNPPSGCRFHPRCPFSERKCEEKMPPLELVDGNHYVACWKPLKEQ